MANLTDSRDAPSPDEETQAEDEHTSAFTTKDERQTSSASGEHNKNAIHPLNFKQRGANVHHFDKWPPVCLFFSCTKKQNVHVQLDGGSRSTADARKCKSSPGDKSKERRKKRRTRSSSSSSSSSSERTNVKSEASPRKRRRRCRSRSRSKTSSRKTKYHRGSKKWNVKGTSSTGKYVEKKKRNNAWGLLLQLCLAKEMVQFGTTRSRNRTERQSVFSAEWWTECNNQGYDVKMRTFSQSEWILAKRVFFLSYDKEHGGRGASLSSWRELSRASTEKQNRQTNVNYQ